MEDESLVRHVSGWILSGSSQEELVRLLEQRGLSRTAADDVVRKARILVATEDRKLFQGNVRYLAGIAFLAIGVFLMVAFVIHRRSSSETHLEESRLFSFGLGFAGLGGSLLVRHRQRKQQEGGKKSAS